MKDDPGAIRSRPPGAHGSPGATRKRWEPSAKIKARYCACSHHVDVHVNGSCTAYHCTCKEVRLGQGGT